MVRFEEADDELVVDVEDAEEEFVVDVEVVEVVEVVEAFVPIPEVPSTFPVFPTPPTPEVPPFGFAGSVLLELIPPPSAIASVVVALLTRVPLARSVTESSIYQLPAERSDDAKVAPSEVTLFPLTLSRAVQE